MTTFARESGRRISPGLSFAAGTLAGATAVFVPLGTLGHRSQLEGASRRSPGAAQPSTPAAGPNAVAASPASSTQREPVKPNDASNEATCDVQLD